MRTYILSGNLILCRLVSDYLV